MLIVVSWKYQSALLNCSLESLGINQSMRNTLVPLLLFIFSWVPKAEVDCDSLTAITPQMIEIERSSSIVAFAFTQKVAQYAFDSWLILIESGNWRRPKVARLPAALVNLCYRKAFLWRTKSTKWKAARSDFAFLEWWFQWCWHNSIFRPVTNAGTLAGCPLEILDTWPESLGSGLGFGQPYLSIMPFTLRA